MPEISLRVRLLGVGKKCVPLMQGFPNSGKGRGGDKILVGLIFLGGEEQANFRLVGGNPQYGKPCDVLFWGLHDPP